MTAADMRKMCEDVLARGNSEGEVDEAFYFAQSVAAMQLATELLKRLDADGDEYRRGFEAGEKSMDARWKLTAEAQERGEYGSARQPVVDREALAKWIFSEHHPFIKWEDQPKENEATWFKKADALLSSGLIRAVPNPTSEKDS